MLRIKTRYLVIWKIITGVVGLGLAVFLFVQSFTNKEQTTDIIFLVDLSHSMNVQDITHNTTRTSRLSTAKNIILDWITEGEVNYSIIWFTQQQSVLIPSTADTSYLETYVEQLHTNMIPQWGSQIQEALMQTRLIYPHAHIVLLTDGWDSEEIKKQKNTTTYIIGTQAWGIVRYPDGWEVVAEDTLPAVSRIHHRHDGIFVSKNNSREIPSQTATSLPKEEQQTLLIIMIILVLLTL